MNYEFNGLLDSILPNIYIHRITLEQTNLPPPSGKYDTMPHIHQAEHPELVTTYAAYQNRLKVTFHMFLEVPNIDSDEFWNFLLDDDLTTYLQTNIILFKGPTAINKYKQLLGQTPCEEPDESPCSLGGLVEGLDDDEGLWKAKGIERQTITGMFNVDSPGLFEYPPDGTTLSQKLKHIKQKYAQTLPDGTIVHKFPIQMTMETDGAFPSDLAALAFCSLDTKQTGKQYQWATDKTQAIGRIATEVIIQKGSIQNKGMIFFISENQPDEAHSKAFHHLKGQLWFGGVHKYNKKYVAGNERNIYILQPYLDYIVVPNNRIQDFRHIATIKKQLFNFNPQSTRILGGSYLDLRSTAAPTDFDNDALFSDLLTSVDQSGNTKAYFCIDWVRLLKKYCAIPRLIDILSEDQQSLLVLLGISPLPLSFKIFREQIGVPNSIINRTNRELIYDSWPNVYHYKDPSQLSAPAVSALYNNVQLPQLLPGLVRHFSFTDYNQTARKGIYKYSIEFEIKDPTLAYMKTQLITAEAGLKEMKKYMEFATGKIVVDTEDFGKNFAEEAGPWNSHLGMFNTTFINFVYTQHWWGGVQGSNLIVNGFLAVWNLLSTMHTVSKSAGTPQNLAPMLDPKTASPQSIVAFYEILDVLTSRLRSFIESFSTAKMPKISSGVDSDGNPVMKNFTKLPIGSEISKRNIKIKYTFEGPSELADTRQKDAGYDIFADVAGQTSDWPGGITGIVGLKMLHLSSYLQKSEIEYYKSFKLQGALGISVDVATPGLNTTPTSILVPTLTTKGRCFTVDKNQLTTMKGAAGGEKWVEFTKLPATIKDVGEEDAYWKIINNIIRYKFNMLGNPDDKSWLGYGDEDEKQSINNIIGSQFIGPTMERILKEYQSLAQQGATFIHKQLVKHSDAQGVLDDPALGPGISESGGAAPKISQGTAQEIKEGVVVPWAKDSGQERFLLALIMQNYFNFGYFDLKLGSFNAAIVGSPIYQMITKANTLTLEKTLARLTQLPHQIKVLLAVHNESNWGKLSEDQNYNLTWPEQKLFGTTATMGAPPEVLNDKTIFRSKFGEFWFKHQNIIEVEYLSGYDKTVPPAAAIASNLEWTEGIAVGTFFSPPKYEHTYMHNIKAPIWEPLTVADAESLLSSGGTLLCRLKKYKFPIFNSEVYNLLDLPLYNEYFFLHN